MPFPQEGHVTDAAAPVKGQRLAGVDGSEDLVLGIEAVDEEDEVFVAVVALTGDGDVRLVETLDAAVRVAPAVVPGAVHEEVVFARLREERLVEVDALRNAPGSGRDVEAEEGAAGRDRARRTVLLVTPYVNCCVSLPM